MWKSFENVFLNFSYVRSIVQKYLFKRALELKLGPPNSQRFEKTSTQVAYVTKFGLTVISNSFLARFLVKVLYSWIKQGKNEQHNFLKHCFSCFFSDTSL